MKILYPQIGLSNKEKKYCRENNIDEKEFLKMKRYERRIEINDPDVEALLNARKDVRVYDYLPYTEKPDRRVGRGFYAKPPKYKYRPI